MENYVTGPNKETWVNYSKGVHGYTMNDTVVIKMSAQSRFFIEQLVGICDYIKVFSTEFRIRTLRHGNESHAT